MTAGMMERPWRWHILPIALLLLQVLAIQARDKSDETSATTDISSTSPSSETTLPDGIGLPAGRRERTAEASGQPAVDAARDILRTLKVPAKKRDRPSGFLGYAIYYAREAFYLLFMNHPSNGINTQPTDKLSPPLKQAVSLLQDAASQNNPDAIFLLAEMNFYGNFTHPRNYSRAFELYKSLATLEGNSTAQYMVGFMYATGIGGAVERHQGQALLYHTFAAMGGDIRSQMTVAFRRYLGIGAPRNCDQAVFYYKQVADQAMAYYRSGPPGGQILTKESYRWADDEGGVYGEGASASSSGANANKDGHHTNSDSILEDVLEYLDLLSKKGDVKATFTLGKMYYDGSRNLKRNERKAMRYFGLVAKKYWTNDGKIISSPPAGIEKTAAKAAAHIGLMFLRGEGIEQSFPKAMTWFQRGRALGDPMCQHYIGLMYLNGHGVPQDVLKAASYFKAAAEQDFPASETRLGALFLDQGDVATATRYFELAARYRWIEAFYYLAEIADQGIGKERHCGMATVYYKMVAEEAEVIHSSFQEANTAYENGDKETALIASMMAAEQGYETAQTNVAYLLDQQRSVLPLDSILPRSRNRRPSLLRNAALALIYWTRSARQANTDSLVKMGDYYFHGQGAPPDLEKALTCYHSAAEGYRSAQAFWNLGWMHENGYATEQDFHLAKRFYDLALETNEEAYLPVKLSLIKLRIRSFWSRITHGKANPIRPEPDAKPYRSLKEWIKAFNSYDQAEDEGLSQRKSKHKSDSDDADNILSQDDAAADSRGETASRNKDNTYYDELDLDIDDDILDSLVILALAAALIVLVYVRQRRGLRGMDHGNGNAGAGGAGAGNGNGNGAERPANNPAGPGDAAAGAQGQEDRGFFPRPGDPDFAAWVAGGTDVINLTWFRDVEAPRILSELRVNLCSGFNSAFQNLAMLSNCYAYDATTIGRLPGSKPRDMEYQAAKRRRIAQATSTLSKPFKSPLRKQVQQTSAENYNEQSDRVSKSEAPINDNTSNSNNMTISTSSSPIPSKINTSHTTSAVIKGPTINITTPPPTTAATKLSSVPSPRAPSELITLQKEHSALTTRLANLRMELDTVVHALKVEQSGQDVELERLIAKWKAASRTAAEELFIGAEERVQRMGGVKGWRDSAKKAQESRARWDYDERGVEDQSGSEEEDKVGRRKAGMEGEIEGLEGVIDSKDGDKGKDGEVDEDESFTMDMMLKSLNIELDVIGFDKDTQQWI
ncbi:hypothetical protein ACJ72_04087 [Emergomyces africanus]|uniref:ERAD-associated E3 ubiquitin-protein ligase component HRD3 n=1 Tax=Emergomyces africanus TaxID=1955775 RepID=A0A1B7NXT3_9EURO|nr:hypothetical protein ACJ72_04087 [Emergomyces africanus]